MLEQELFKIIVGNRWGIYLLLYAFPSLAFFYVLVFLRKTLQRNTKMMRALITVIIDNQDVNLKDRKIQEVLDLKGE